MTIAGAALQPQLSPEAVALLNMVATKDAGTSAGAMLHGPGGLLATPGLNKQIMNAMIMPRGLAGRIPITASIDTNEIFGIMTGLTATTGSEPTTACSDWPVVGQFKLCKQQHPFGQQGRESQVLNIKYAGQLVNRGEFRDNVLFGKPNTGEDRLPGAIDWTRVLQIESEKKLGELFLGYYRDYAPYMYTGNPQTTAGSAGFQQYRGLNLLINTGKRDAVSGALCPAADSIVIDLNGTSINASGGVVYAIIANIMNNLERLTEQLSLDVTWGIVGRYGLWQVLTQIWPCIYATTGCPGTTGVVVQTGSLQEQVQLRDQIRNTRRLPIEGKNYEFIIDDAIVETVAAGGAVGTYQSDLYIVPLTANGQPMLFWEYFPMVEQAIQAANALAPGGYFSTLDNGRFLFSRLSPTHTCVQVEIIERPRLILMAPFLAARVQNLRYTYSIHEREWDPNSPYFANGGGTNTPLPYWYPNATGG